MHILDGVLSTPVCAATGVLAAGALYESLRQLRTSLADRTIPLTGMMSALVFAGQMVNFPLVGTPVSGHLLGGVLAAVILGPWAGCLSLTLVLVVQAALFGDGGWQAMGTNVLHMAVIGSIGGYAVYVTIRRLLGNGPRGILVGAVVASWLTVMAASALFCLEFWLSWRGTGKYDFKNIFTLMVSLHSLIGIGEALITGTVIAFVLAHRPDLIYSPHAAPSLSRGVGSTFAAGMVIALAIAAFLAPFASAFPDGLEAVAGEKGFLNLARAWGSAPIADYEFQLPTEWQTLSVSLAGIVGTVAVALIALAIGRALKPRSSPAVHHVE